MVKLTQLFSQHMTPMAKSGNSNTSIMDMGATPSEFQQLEVNVSSNTFKPERFETEMNSVQRDRQLETAHTVNRSEEKSQARMDHDAAVQRESVDRQEQHVSNAHTQHESTKTTAAAKTEASKSGDVSNAQIEQPKENIAPHKPETKQDKKIHDLEKAIHEVKDSMSDVKKEILKLFKDMGIDVDPKSVTFENMAALKSSLKSLKEGSDPQKEIQLNEIVHLLQSLSIQADVAPMNKIEFDISGKKEVSYLGTVSETVVDRLEALLQKLGNMSKRLGVMKHKQAELNALKIDGFLPVQKEDASMLKNGLMDKIRDVFSKDQQGRESESGSKEAANATHAHRTSAVDSKMETGKTSTPQLQSVGQGIQSDGQAQNGAKERKEQSKQSAQEKAGLMMGQPAQGQVKGADVKVSESFQVQHSVKIDGEKITIEKTKEAASSRGAQQTNVVRQVVKQVTMMVDNSKASMSMQLKPEHLGRVNIDLNMEDSKMRLSLKVETESAKQVVEGGMAQLKESLAAQGITIEKIDVDVSNENEFANLREQQEEQQSRFKGHRRIQEVTLEVDIEKEGLETGRRLGYNTMEYVA